MARRGVRVFPTGRANLAILIRCRNWLPLAAALLVVISACSTPRGLVPVEAPAERAWRDDGAPETLAAAIDRSIGYFARLPEDTVFHYGGLRYSPREMIASLELFLQIWRTSADDAERRARIAASFELFESIALEGRNLFTGYYEPVVRGSHMPAGPHDTPLLARPVSMVEVDLSLFGDDLPRRRLVGRLEDGRLRPFYSRQEIHEHKAVDDIATPIAYVDKVDLFFLQIQGSGVVEFPDGERIKVNFNGSNGHPYRSIGAVLVRRDIMEREEVTMQSIRDYLARHPDAVLPVLYENPSYTFFRVVDEGPLGNIGVPLTPERSIALDHRLFPKGGLAYVELDVPMADDPQATRPFHRFMVVQDTGGAIRGHGRADIFFGQGETAEAVAGRLKHPGRLWLLVAKKSVLHQSMAEAEEPPASTQGIR